MNTPGLRACIVDWAVLASLDRLWAGDLRPEDLVRIEVGIRSYLLHDRLVFDKSGPVWSTPDASSAGYIAPEGRLGSDFPISSESLRYDFEELDKALELEHRAPSGLVERITEAVIKQAIASIPESAKTRGSIYDHIDQWYEGSLPGDHRYTVLWDGAPDGRNLLTREEFSAEGGHAIFHLGPKTECRYWIDAYRSGFGVCSVKPMALACEKEIFSRWPTSLFADFGAEYEKSSRNLRPPGYFFDLPPLLALVFSRAKRRSGIPEVLIELRSELEADRKKLWALVGEMWEAKTRAQQEKIAAALDAAAKSIFPAAFPERRMSVIATAIDFATLNWSEALHRVHENDQSRQQVGAVSFAGKLAKIFRKDLRNERDLFWEFLGPVERKRFGI